MDEGLVRLTETAEGFKVWLSVRQVNKKAINNPELHPQLEGFTEARTVGEVEDAVKNLNEFPFPNAYLVEARGKWERKTKISLYFLEFREYNAAMDFLNYQRRAQRFP